MSRTMVLAALALALAAGNARAQEEEAELEVKGGGTLPTGWLARIDGRDTTLAKVLVENVAGGVHVRTAKSLVLYRPTDRLSRNYHFAGTFTQNEPSPGHAEPFGLVIGGANLGDSTLSYTYFLVRTDGKFQIRRRAGRRNTDVVEGWVDHAAVKQADASGKASNRLMVEVTPTAVRFLVNNTEVHRTTPDKVDANGIAGWRFTHNVDVTVTQPMRMQM